MDALALLVLDEARWTRINAASRSRMVRWVLARMLVRMRAAVRSDGVRGFVEVGLRDMIRFGWVADVAGRMVDGISSMLSPVAESENLAGG